MGIIDHDISRNITARTRNARLEGLDSDRVYYADDTLTITYNNNMHASMQ